MAAAENPDACRTIMTLTGHGSLERFEHVYLAAAAALAAITAFFRGLHIHWQLEHPPQSRGPVHLEVSFVAAQGCGLVLPQLEWQQLTVRPGFEPQACRVPT